jgi:hypothetical protein
MKQVYKFLNDEDSKIVNNIIQSYFTDARINKIIDSIDSLTLSKVEKFHFNYFEIFDDSIVKEYINEDNIFYYVDFYCMNNKLHYSSPLLRNTMSILIKNSYNEICKKYKFKSILDKKIINLIEDSFFKNPMEFEDFYDSYSADFSKNVNSKCKIIMHTYYIMKMQNKEKNSKQTYLKILQNKFSNTILVRLFSDYFSKLETYSESLEFFEKIKNFFNDDIKKECEWMVHSKKYDII